MTDERKADLLVIHPDPFWCRNIAAFCSTYGYTAEVSFDSEEGVNLLREQPYPVIVLALALPISLSDVEKVLQRSPSSQVLVLSGSCSDIDAAVRMGAYDYIHDPFCIELLIRRVHLAYCEFLLARYGQGCRRYIFEQIRPLLVSSCFSEEVLPDRSVPVSPRRLEIEVNRTLGHVIRQLRKFPPDASDAFTS